MPKQTLQLNRDGIFRYAVCLVWMLMGLQCASAAPATQPATQAAVPILYDDSFLAHGLSAEQTAQVLAKAEKVRPKDQAVWFILVIDNYYPILFPLEHDFRVKVYFAPEPVRKGQANAANPRLRRGHNAYIYSDSEAAVLHEYVQVAPVAQLFKEKLEIPVLVDLPFQVNFTRDEQPVLVPDDQIVRLADFARPILQKWSKHPLRSISGDGEKFGIMAGIGGSATQIDVRKTGDKLEREGGMVAVRF